MVYSVVETIEDEEYLCVAVPECWLVGNNILKWPGRLNYLKYLKSKKEPGDDWEEYPISRVLSQSIATWTEARRKERLLERTSNSELEDITTIKLRKNQNVSYLDCTSEDDYNANSYFEKNVVVGSRDNIDDSLTGRNLSPVKDGNQAECSTLDEKLVKSLEPKSYRATPVFRQNCFSDKYDISTNITQNRDTFVSSNSAQKKIGNSELSSQLPLINTESGKNPPIIVLSANDNSEKHVTPIFKTINSNATNETSPILKTPGFKHNMTSSSIVLTNVRNLSQDDIIMPLPTKGLININERRYVMNVEKSATCNQSCLQCCNSENSQAVLKNILGSLSLLNEGVQGLFTEIKYLKRELCSTNDKPSFHLLPKMPFTTPEELTDFESELSSNFVQKQQLIERFRQIGGKGVGSSLRKCLKILATDETLAQFSWVGIRNKLKFCDFVHVLDSIYESIIKNNPEATQTEINNNIKNWLKHSQERLMKKNNTVN